MRNPTGLLSHPAALLLLATFSLLPFLRLACFAHSYLDDFIFPIMLRQHGVWQHTVTMYLTYQGRFSASLITALHPLAWGGMQQVQPFVFGFISLVAGSFLVAGNALLRGGQIRYPTRLAAGGLVLSLFLLMLPSPTEAFYWLLSGLTYMGGLAFCFALLATIAVLHSAPPARPQWAWWGLAAALAFFAPGFTEMVSCLVLGLVFVLAPAALRGQLQKRWLVLLALAVVGSAVATLAPGNFVRHEAMPSPPLLRSLLLAAGTLGYTVASWLSNGLLLVLTLLVLPALQNVVSQPALPLTKLTRHVWRWPAWVLLGLFICYVFSHMAVGGPPPSRARNVLFAFFLVGWFFSVAGWLAYRTRQGLPALPELPDYARVALSSALLLLIMSDHNFKLRRSEVGAATNSVTQAYRDWLSGDAKRYDQEEEARYALIQRTTQDEVALPALSVQPHTLVWWDISSNPAMWGNQAYAQYFRKGAIWVKRPSK